MHNYNFCGSLSSKKLEHFTHEATKKMCFFFLRFVILWNMQETHLISLSLSFSLSLSVSLLKVLLLLNRNYWRENLTLNLTFYLSFV